MRRTPVDSSDLVSVGYTAAERLLEIEFKGGRVYQYIDVPPDIYKGLIQADSYGRYFYAYINIYYRYRKVEELQSDVQSLAFVTGNARKFRDMKSLCEQKDITIEQLELEVDEIQSYDPEKIATHKAKQAYKLAKRPVVVQDTSWNILALKGFPGAYMQYVTGWLRAQDFLALMAGKQDRSIACIDTLAYHDGKRTKIFTRTHWGEVIAEARGTGPSIDQVVVMAGETKTIAECEAAEVRSSVNLTETAYHDFVKWYYLQKRIKRV